MAVSISTRTHRTNMSRNFPLDVQTQNFLTESINNERDARLNFFLNRPKDVDEKPKSKQYEIFKKRIEAGCPQPTQALLDIKDIKPKRYNRRIYRYQDHIEEMFPKQLNASLTVPKDMNAASGSEKAVLYDGFTKEGKGRYLYLRNRHSTIPESKYNFPVLSSWEYGWRLSDVMNVHEIKKPPFGRTRIVGDTFYTRNGIPTLNQHSSSAY